MMKNLRIARIAVTLPLIVAMMIQPAAVVFAGTACAKECTPQELVCSGCGCCEIEQVGDRCCCCGSPENEAASDEVGSALTAIDISVAAIQTPCKCGVSVPPMNHRAMSLEFPRHSNLRAGFDSVADVERNLCRKGAPLAPDLFNRGRCDFGQRFLCVWRI